MLSYCEETGSFKGEEEKMSWSSLDLVETRWDSVSNTMDTASLRMEDGEGWDEACIPERNEANPHLSRKSCHTG